MFGAGCSQIYCTAERRVKSDRVLEIEEPLCGNYVFKLSFQERIDYPASLARCGIDKETLVRGWWQKRLQQGLVGLIKAIPAAPWSELGS